MHKIISLFQRNYETDHLVRNEVVPGAEWVLNGEGTATRKYDGMCCAILNGKLLKRYELKPGKTPPANWQPVELDENTGKQVGWVPVDDGPNDRYFREALQNMNKTVYGSFLMLEANTCELVGPKVQGNPERLDKHYLLPHAKADVLTENPRTFESIREYLRTHDIEGIVWHHPDGRMIKIKGKDFGFKRNGNEEVHI